MSDCFVRQNQWFPPVTTDLPAVSPADFDDSLPDRSDLLQYSGWHRYLYFSLCPTVQILLLTVSSPPEPIRNHPDKLPPMHGNRNPARNIHSFSPPAKYPA